MRLVIEVVAPDFNNPPYYRNDETESSTSNFSANMAVSDHQSSNSEAIMG